MKEQNLLSVCPRNQGGIPFRYLSGAIRMKVETKEEEGSGIIIQLLLKTNE